MNIAAIANTTNKLAKKVRCLSCKVAELEDGGDSVISFNSRIGAVVPQSGDYTFAQIGSTPTTLAGYGITNAVSGGDNGVTITTGIARLGQTVSQVGDPAILTAIREIPLATFGLKLRQATTTTTAPILELNATWNNASSNQRMLYATLLNTASAISSTVIDIRNTNTVEIFQVYGLGGMLVGSTVANNFMQFKTITTANTGDISFNMQTNSTHNGASTYTYNAAYIKHNIADSGSALGELYGVRVQPSFSGANTNIFAYGVSVDIATSASLTTSKIVAFKNLEGHALLCMNTTGTGGVRIGGGANNLATARLHLAVGTATAGTSPLKFIAGTNMTTPEIGSVEYNGTNLTLTNSTVLRGTFNIARTNVSAAGTLAITTTYTYYIATGTTTTWTLPALTGNTNQMFYFKNRGSGDITLNSNVGATDIYTTTAVSTVTIAAGASLTMIHDGTYWTTI